MKSFDEWFDSQDDVGCIIGIEGYAAKKAWDCKQAEVDELRKRIDGIVGIITEAYKSGGNSSVETVYDKIQELLK